MEPTRSRQDIESDLAEVQREIIGLEEVIRLQREDSGSNSLDDDGQEAADAEQKLALLAAQIDAKRQQMMKLQEELSRAA